MPEWAMSDRAFIAGIVDRDVDRVLHTATQGMNRPLSMLLLLGVLVLVIYVVFSLGRMCVKKAVVMISPGPLDPEDHFFTDEHYTRSSRFAFVKSPYDAFSNYTDQVAVSGAHQGRCNRSLPCSGTKLVLNTSARGTTPPPPPAYTSSPRFPVPHWSSSYSFLNQQPPPKAKSKAYKPSFTSLPKIRLRKPQRPTISKPIMHPEGPLPGPPIEFDSTDSFSALLKPSIAPHAFSNTDLHPAAVYLPAPSEAYIHNRDSHDATFRTGHSSRFLSVGGVSGVMGHPKLDVSIASSKIGLAF